MGKTTIDKMKLFRRGRYVGLVNQNFYQTEPEPSVWVDLEIPVLL